LALDKLSTPDLVNALDSSNEWQRDKTQQLLLWRNDKSAILPLQNLAHQSTNALARLHALWTLDGLGALTPDLLESAFKDENPGMRENALRLAETHYTPAIMRAASALVNDPSAKVRLQLACTLGEWTNVEAGGALAQLAHNASDPFISAAIMSSALPHLELIARLNGPAIDALAEPLFATALGLNRRDVAHHLLKSIFEAYQFAKYSAFLDLLNRRKTSTADLIKAAPNDDLGKLLARQPELIQRAFASVIDSSHRPGPFDALELLAHDPQHQAIALDGLAGYLHPATPIDRQRKVINLIANTGATNVPALLLASWSNRSPETKSACLEALLRREPWTYDLAQQIESGAIAPSDLDTARRNRLLKHSSKRVSELAQKIFSQPANSNRAIVIEQFRPALELTGATAHGKEVFAKLCSTCHQLDGVGNQVGPDLKSVAEHAPEKILVNILDPNADIQPGYNAYNCALANGEELYGLISAETAASVVFKFADGTTRDINRKEINALRSSNLSLMPEGLEQGLSRQDLADLIAYIKSH
jgi:putative heme-binding domain-containing protein